MPAPAAAAGRAGDGRDGRYSGAFVAGFAPADIRKRAQLHFCPHAGTFWPIAIQ